MPFSTDHLRPILSLARTVVFSLPRNPLALIRAYRIADNSGLFDQTYYQTQLTKPLSNGQDPLVHYLTADAETRADPHPLFDTTFYLAQDPTVAEQGLNPLVHYLTADAETRADPHPLFDQAFYCAHGLIDRVKNETPLTHFLRIGCHKNIDPHPLFDSSFYLDKYPDVAEQGIPPAIHFVRFGLGEGRKCHPLFDADYYTKLNPDGVAAAGNPLLHFLQTGGLERRSPHLLFDTPYYLDRYPEVAEQGLNPLVHYLQKTLEQRTNPHPLFDTTFYLAQDPTVAEQGLNPLVHFLDEGGISGYSPSSQFDSAYYLRVYPAVKQHGLNPLVHFLTRGINENRYPLNDMYRAWIDENEKPTNLGGRSDRIESLSIRPLISVLMPTYNTDAVWLKKAIDSVLCQVYSNWELCIADDGSTQSQTKELIESYAQSDPRIKVVFRPTTGHIATASNSALELVTGEFVALMDHDDELSQNALYEIAATLNLFPDTDFIYSDEDKITTSGERFDPFFKPDWAPDMLLSHMYCGHLSVYRTATVRSLEGFRSGYDGSQDYDLTLRLTEQTQKIRHIPKILYHWRTIEGSTASGKDAKNYAYRAAERALRGALDRRKTGAAVRPVSPDHPAFFRVTYPLRSGPDVAVILPIINSGRTLKELEHLVQVAADLSRCPGFKPVAVVQSQKDAEALFLIPGLEDFDVLVNQATTPSLSPYPTLVNTGVAATESELILVMDHRLRFRNLDRLKEMAARAQQRHTGAVGPMLLSHDGTIHGAGLILRGDLPPMHSHEQHSIKSAGYFGHLLINPNCSAISSDCLMTRRELFLETGGFDIQLPRIWASTDYCLRLSEQGLNHTVQTDLHAQFVEPVPTGSTPRPNSSALMIMQERWSETMKNDPFFSPHLNRKKGWYTLSNFDLGNYLPSARS
ncbi:MAG: glycosyltransferase [Acidiferrobacteraceae bacterium]|nr:glycosyltransferase [Acidiferrobacteraceae bacterium]